MKKILLLATATIALVACNNDDNYVDEPIAAQISATIGESATTRASETSWANGDKIGVTMGDRYANTEYTTATGNGIFAGTTMYFKNKREPVTLTAYYPFTGIEGTAAGTIETNTTATNQTTGNQPKIDFLYAKEENVAGSNPNIKFTFSHQMSKLTLIFKNGSGADVSKIVSYEVGGLVLNGTFNTASGVCAAKTDAVPAPLKISPAAGTVKHAVALPSLLIFPQATAGKTVTLTITDSDQQVYACELAFKDNQIASGNNYQFTITVNKTGLTINESTISDWVTNGSETNASLINPK